MNLQHFCSVNKSSPCSYLILIFYQVTMLISGFIIGMESFINDVRVNPFEKKAAAKHQSIDKSIIRNAQGYRSGIGTSFLSQGYFLFKRLFTQHGFVLSF